MPLGDIAQLVERLLCKQEVRGSIPRVSTQVRGPFRSSERASFMPVLQKSTARGHRTPSPNSLSRRLSDSLVDVEDTWVAWKKRWKFRAAVASSHRVQQLLSGPVAGFNQSDPGLSEARRTDRMAQPAHRSLAGLPRRITRCADWTCRCADFVAGRNQSGVSGVQPVPWRCYVISSPQHTHLNSRLCDGLCVSRVRFSGNRPSAFQ
jgi:hypothetical protein